MQGWQCWCTSAGCLTLALRVIKQREAIEQRGIRRRYGRGGVWITDWNVF